MVLVQILAEYDYEKDSYDRIQIDTGGNVDEVLTNSHLLIPFYRWEVVGISGERSFIDGTPVIRVTIQPGKYRPQVMKPPRKAENRWKPSRNAGFSFAFQLYAI